MDKLELDKEIMLIRQAITELEESNDLKALELARADLDNLLSQVRN